MNDERERAIRERLAAATPGEWSWDKHYTLLRTDKPPFEAYPNEVEILDAWYYPENGDPIAADVDVRPTDAALIAAAPADIRYLLARVRELEEALAYRDQDVEIAMQVIFDITGLHSLYDVHDMFRSRSKAICLENNIGSVRWRGNPNPPKREDNRNE